MAIAASGARDCARTGARDLFIAANLFKDVSLTRHF
jgi:hypothetical protein